MSKAEKFIKEHQMDCTNESIKRGEYYHWITPDQARKAVEIAREEIMDEVCDYIKNNLCKHLYVYDGHAGFPTYQFVEDLKQAMKDE